MTAQAKHSPKDIADVLHNHRSNVSYRDDCQACQKSKPIFSKDEVVELTKQLRSHAQRLADALTWVIGDDTTDEPAIIEAREALAEWEKSK